MVFEEFITVIIKDIGLPAAMVLWFMFRNEKVIEKNTKVMESVIDRIDLCKLEK